MKHGTMYQGEAHGSVGFFGSLRRVRHIGPMMTTPTQAAIRASQTAKQEHGSGLSIDTVVVYEILPGGGKKEYKVFDRRAFGG